MGDKKEPIPLSELDVIVEKLKKAPTFTILSRGKEHRFIFNEQTATLYLYKKDKQYIVANSSSALYAFANKASYFELNIYNPDDIVHPLYMLYDIEIVKGI